MGCRSWPATCRDVGGFHTFRHTCATVLFNNGWNAKQVQLQLGHHSPEFTLKVYVECLAKDLPAHPGVGGATPAATRPTENDRDDARGESAETLKVPGYRDSPRSRAQNHNPRVAGSSPAAAITSRGHGTASRSHDDLLVFLVSIRGGAEAGRASLSGGWASARTPRYNPRFAQGRGLSRRALSL